MMKLEWYNRGIGELVYRNLNKRRPKILFEYLNRGYDDNKCVDNCPFSKECNKDEIEEESKKKWRKTRIFEICRWMLENEQVTEFCEDNLIDAADLVMKEPIL